MDKLFSDPASLATILAVPLTALLTFIVTILVQLWSERHQRLQVTYSTSSETPSILAQSEINKNLHMSYQGKEVSELRYFSVNIENSGRQNIDDFQFICEFEDSVQSIDSNFPQIFTTAPPNVEPDEPVLDQSKSAANLFYYTTKNFVIGQSIELNFLFAGSKQDQLSLKFVHPQYKIQKGVVSAFPTLERNIQSALLNLVLFYIIIQISPAIPAFFLTIGAGISSAIGINLTPGTSNYGLSFVLGYIPAVLQGIGSLIGVLIGLPFLLRALRSIRPIIPVVARKLGEGLEAKKVIEPPSPR